VRRLGRGRWQSAILGRQTKSAKVSSVRAAGEGASRRGMTCTCGLYSLEGARLRDAGLPRMMEGARLRDAGEGSAAGGCGLPARRGARDRTCTGGVDAYSTNIISSRSPRIMYVTSRSFLPIAITHNVLFSLVFL
jgi:hypothetical protein